MRFGFLHSDMSTKGWERFKDRRIRVGLGRAGFRPFISNPEPSEVMVSPTGFSKGGINPLSFQIDLKALAA
jgi:hypothetical protein